jgi:hypothetical protein
MSLTSDQQLYNLAQEYEEDADALVKKYKDAVGVAEKLGILSVALGKLYFSQGIEFAAEEVE